MTLQNLAQLKYSSQARQRRFDAFACPQKIVQLLEILLEKAKNDLSPYINLNRLRENNYQLLINILQRASNFLRSGGKSKPNRKNQQIPVNVLLNMVETMSEILQEHSQKRISFRTFTDNYLRVLSCPEDIKEWLEVGQITLFEALQLKRLNEESLNIGKKEAIKIRAEFFNHCRNQNWIIHRLREEIDLKLGKSESSIDPEFAEISKATQRNLANLTNLQIEEINFSPSSESFFREQIYLMMEMLNFINFNELEKKEQEMLLVSVDAVILQLQKLTKKTQKRVKETKAEKDILGFLS